MPTEFRQAFDLAANSGDRTGMVPTIKHGGRLIVLGDRVVYDRLAPQEVNAARLSALHSGTIQPELDS